MRQRVSLQSLITLSVLSVGMLSGTVGLAYAYWHAKQSLQTTVGITFQEIARQSADKTALLLAKEIEWMRRLSALPDIRASVEGSARVGQAALQFERWREEQHRYFHSLVIVRADGQLVGAGRAQPREPFMLNNPGGPLFLPTVALGPGLSQSTKKAGVIGKSRCRSVGGVKRCAAP